MIYAVAFTVLLAASVLLYFVGPVIVRVPSFGPFDLLAAGFTGGRGSLVGTAWVPFLVVLRSDATAATEDHERLHQRQMAELAIVGFYILYVALWLRGLRGGLRDAYYTHPMELAAEAGDLRWCSWRFYLGGAP